MSDEMYISNEALDRDTIDELESRMNDDDLIQFFNLKVNNLSMQMST